MLDAVSSFQGASEEAVSKWNPFPGLRSFHEKEGDFFFGRDSLSVSLALQLHQNGFIAAVGPSGSGKSSLVRSGVVKFLKESEESDESLIVVTFAPRSDPYASFAQELHTQLSEFGQKPTPSAETLEEMLRSCTDGFNNIVRAFIPAKTHLLVIVDQFEEMIRIVRPKSPDDADRFVALLLCSIDAIKKERKRTAAAPSEEQSASYVSMALTMRSEYLGAAALFRDLPELLTDHQYLIPRMTPAQLRQAIEGPITEANRILRQTENPLESTGKTIEPKLVDRLLNDVAILEASWEKPLTGSESDQAPTAITPRSSFDTLPMLQFALRQLWERTRKEPTITDADYTELIGKMSGVCKKMIEVPKTTSTLPKALPLLSQATTPSETSLEERRLIDVAKQAKEVQESPLRVIFSGVASSLYDESLSTNQPFIRGAFMRLCGQGDGATLDVRRPTRLSELAKVTNTSPANAAASLAPFADSNVGFLQITTEESTPQDPLYDISHESLIRQWHLLDIWVREEARLSRILRRFNDNAAFEASLGLARPRDMALLQDIYRVYPDGDAFTTWTHRYISRSEREQFTDYYKRSKQIEDRRNSSLRAILLFILLILLIIFLSMYIKNEEYKKTLNKSIEIKDNKIIKLEEENKEDAKNIAKMYQQDFEKAIEKIEVTNAIKQINQRGADENQKDVTPQVKPANQHSGFDINEYAAVSNWQEVKKRVGYVYIRATIPGAEDKKFVTHWNEADKAGLSVGAFHVFNASVSGEKQADDFCEILRKTDALKDRRDGYLLRENDMPAMVYPWSLSGTPAKQAIAEFHKCLIRIQQVTGKRPLINTNPYFWINNFERLTGKNPHYDRMYYYPLALSHYTSAPEKVKIPKLWKDHGGTWSLWNYTDAGKIPSVYRRNNLPVLVTLSRINESKPLNWAIYASANGDLENTTITDMLARLKKYDHQPDPLTSPGPDGPGTGQ